MGAKIQVTFEVKRKKELKHAFKQEIVGVVVGAIIGHAIRRNDYYAGCSAAIAAFYGGALAGSSGADAVVNSQIIAKFVPAGIIDKCMTDRGYTVLPQEKFGGGWAKGEQGC